MSRKSNKARELRRDPSRAEKICWEMEGIKFRSQYPLGPYFADFACVSKRLIIEIDGDHHADKAGAGWKVVRFGAAETMQNPEGIWAAIQALVSDSASPPLLTSPPSGGEEHEGRV
jgi:very-short-patch-repair endonuclease